MTDPYRAIAAFYERLLSPALRRLREDIRTYVYFRGAKRVVDVCCGTGAQLTLLDKPGMDLHGLDNSAAMLEIARSNRSERLHYHHFNAEEPYFSDNSFDCAIISLALHEKTPATARLLFDNAWNLIRDRGFLVIADYAAIPNTFTGRLLSGTVIPLIERLAGRNHFDCYRQWCQHGGLEGFLTAGGKRVDIISNPAKGTILCCGVNKDEKGRLLRQNFGLLDHELSPTFKAFQHGNHQH